ncbi:hypothetical protein FRAHR75_150007 [Frankia sp. Hr75.2]|nr:hypothetical protein FRAHR75_150007 [Frankia sp. Hr75.2]
MDPYVLGRSAAIVISGGVLLLSRRMIVDPGVGSTRDCVVRALVELMVGTCPDRVLRVAIDGPDAAGKTTRGGERCGAHRRRCLPPPGRAARLSGSQRVPSDQPCRIAAPCAAPRRRPVWFTRRGP